MLAGTEPEYFIDKSLNINYLSYNKFFIPVEGIDKPVKFPDARKASTRCKMLILKHLRKTSWQRRKSYHVLETH